VTNFGLSGFSLNKFHVVKSSLDKNVNIMFERISVDPKVFHGQACIKGTRIPVHQIVLMLANGDTIDDLLKDYPTITREDVLACLEYAGALAEEEVTPLEALA